MLKLFPEFLNLFESLAELRLKLLGPALSLALRFQICLDLLFEPSLVAILIILRLPYGLQLDLERLSFLRFQISLLLQRVDLLSLLRESLVEVELRQQQLLLLSRQTRYLEGQRITLLGQVVDLQGPVV